MKRKFTSVRLLAILAFATIVGVSAFAQTTTVTADSIVLGNKTEIDSVVVNSATAVNSNATAITPVMATTMSTPVSENTQTEITKFDSAKKYRKFSVFAKGGIQLVNIFGDKRFTDDGTGVFGPNIGVAFEYRPTTRWAIQPEVLFSMQGVKYKQFYASTAYYYTQESVTTNYINIPLFAKFYIIPGKLSVEVGPQLGICVYNSYEGYSSKDFYNKCSCSLAFGLSYYKRRLMIQIRYDMGVTNVYKPKFFEDFSAGTIVGQNINNRLGTLQINIGIRLNR